MQSIKALILKQINQSNDTVDNTNTTPVNNNNNTTVIKQCNCNDLQLKWIKEHPIVKSIQKLSTIHDIKQYVKSDQYCLINGPNPSWLLPINDPMMYNSTPILSDYITMLHMGT